MNTRETVHGYFGALKQGKGWDAFLAEGMVFSSMTSPVKRVTGKAAFLDATRRFYGMIASVTVTTLMVEGKQACALTRYELQPPQGSGFTSEVAEVFLVVRGKIEAFDIYFDSAPFPK